MKTVMINGVAFIFTDKTAKLYEKYRTAETNLRYMVKQGKPAEVIAKYEKARDVAWEKLVA
jgi:hypothetical protein